MAGFTSFMEFLSMALPQCSSVKSSFKPNTEHSISRPSDCMPIAGCFGNLQGNFRFEAKDQSEAHGLMASAWSAFLVHLCTIDPHHDCTSKSSKMCTSIRLKKPEGLRTSSAVTYKLQADCASNSSTKV
ncbi:unnamed protein product [Calypogeia fissa]